jgi:hypothetical protein
MNIDINIGGELVHFSHNKWSGGAKLSDGSHVVKLASGLSVSDNIKMQKLTIQWNAIWNGHEVKIDRTRKLFFSNFRKMHYRITVDGQLIVDIDG